MKYHIKKSNKKNKNQKLNYLTIYINHVYKLFSKYYELINRMKIYIIAMILNSCQKYFYFYIHWNKEHYNEIKKKIQALYKEFHVDENIDISSSINSQWSLKKRKIDDFDINAFQFERSEII